MQIIENPQRKDWSRIVQRPTQTVENIEKTVIQIFDDVKRNGDKAVKKYTAIRITSYNVCYTKLLRGWA